MGRESLIFENGEATLQSYFKVIYVYYIDHALSGDTRVSSPPMYEEVI